MSHQTIVLTHCPGGGGIDPRRSDAVSLRSFARGAYTASLHNAILILVGVASHFLLSSPAAAAKVNWVGYQSGFGIGNPFTYASFFHGDNWANFHVPTEVDYADFDASNRARLNGPPTNIYFGDVNLPPYTASNNVTFIPGGAANVGALSVSGGEFAFIFDANAPFTTQPPTLFHDGTLTASSVYVGNSTLDKRDVPATLHLRGPAVSGLARVHADFQADSITVEKEGHLFLEDRVTSQVSGRVNVYGNLDVDNAYFDVHSGLSSNGTVDGGVGDVVIRGGSIVNAIHPDTFANGTYNDDLRAGIIVGSNGHGKMTIEGGSQVSTSLTGLADSVDIGINISHEDAYGELVVRDSGTKLETVNGISMDFGEMRVENGGQVLLMQSPFPISFVQSTIGLDGTGVVTITGQGSKWTTSKIGVGGAPNLSVDVPGHGTITVSDHGELVDYGKTSIAYSRSSTGELVVKDSALASLNALDVGVQGQGKVHINSQGKLKVDGTVRAGIYASSVGVITVAGAASVDTKSLELGVLGNASLICADRGAVHVSSDLLIGQSGNVEIDDTSVITVGNVGENSAPGILTVGSGGTLSGKGSIAGDVAIAGGTLSPGASPGILKFNSDLSLDTNSILKLEIAGTTAGLYDQLQVTGDLSILGTIQVSFLNGFRPLAGNSFRFFDVQGMLAFQNASFSLPSGYTIESTGDGSFRFVAAVPEPTAVSLVLAGFVAAITFRKR